MSLNMKPCPVCNEESFGSHRSVDKVQLYCLGCGCKGPGGKTLEEAVELWNKEYERLIITV